MGLINMIAIKKQPTNQKQNKKIEKTNKQTLTAVSESVYGLIQN